MKTIKSRNQAYMGRFDIVNSYLCQVNSSGCLDRLFLIQGGRRCLHMLTSTAYIHEVNILKRREDTWARLLIGLQCAFSTELLLPVEFMK